MFLQQKPQFRSRKHNRVKVLEAVKSKSPLYKHLRAPKTHKIGSNLTQTMPFNPNKSRPHN